MSVVTISRSAWMNSAKGAVLPLATLMLVMLMVVPIPAMLLDIGFVINIMISLAVLMVVLNVTKPTDFSSFPTVLLFATLFRLALNVASTRVVLVEGHNGPGAAGHVIEAFGSFLIGGDYAVGIFVFLILMIINLVVITKGAGRVSEVSARFILDALPGKQMAIDADLNAGLLTPEGAKERRQEVATEADFYGSMDGASKFVKGDAIAGVLILVVNMLGGLILGTLSHGLSLSDAASIYLLLAIGDALVAQVPALLLSIAAASIVTRVNSPLDLSGQIASQFGSGRAWVPVAVILAIIGILPGMPHVIILTAAAGAGYAAHRLLKAERAAAIAAAAPPPPDTAPTIGWEDVSSDSMITLELGFGLIGMVDERKGAPLMSRITGIRRQLSRELGFVIPLVRVRDELSLGANQYRISISGVAVAEDSVWADELLAIESGTSIAAPIDGRAARDPTFGLDAIWIDQQLKNDAIVAGYTVVDAPTVIVTHLNQMIVNAAADLFGVDEAQELLDALKQTAPQLVSNLTPAPMTLPAIARLCRALLAEQVPLRDFRRIADAMASAARDDVAGDALTEEVRQRIGGIIVQSIVDIRATLPVITLDAELEGLLAQAVRVAGDSPHPIEPGLAQRIIEAVAGAAAPLLAADRRFAIVTSPLARRALRRLLGVGMPNVPVLSFLEIPDAKPVEVVAVVGSRTTETAPELLELETP
jgi:flagellar biosynthesis protein FlhA